MPPSPTPSRLDNSGPERSGYMSGAVAAELSCVPNCAPHWPLLCPTE